MWRPIEAIARSKALPVRRRGKRQRLPHPIRWTAVAGLILFACDLAKTRHENVIMPRPRRGLLPNANQLFLDQAASPPGVGRQVRLTDRVSSKFSPSGGS